MTIPAIEFKNVSKYFGEVKANSDISFSVAPGTIHAIVGENGAGKSTAMKILFGMYQADEGEILLSGHSVQFHSPIDSMNAKIGMVHQHFMLAEPLSALDNILLHQKGSAFSVLPRKEQKQKLDTLAARYGFNLNLNAKVEDLSVGEQQRLEILKILSQDSQILILDEPTAVLTPQEVTELFENLRQLKLEGKTILIITHKLKEVVAITDHVTVFRAGKIVGNKVTAETNATELAEMMVGRRIQNPQERSTFVEKSEVLLQLDQVSAKLGTQEITGLFLKVHSREIVGIAGVEGNGQNVLIRALVDRRSLQKNSFLGNIQIKESFASFPEDRLRFGVLPSRPTYENFVLGHHRSPLFSQGIFLKQNAIVHQTQEAMNKFDIRPHNPNLPFEKMSGGNQQKLVVARELSQNPKVILAAQPTRGVDIGAIEFIHNQLRKARDNGAGILLVSSELDELMALSDRIVVLYKGKFVAEFQRSEFNEIAIGTAMGGGH